jgi:hypothetical protein
MEIRNNPFQQLYVSESAQPIEFVQLFSPILVKHFQSLFQPGNIILRGTQGSGKTMLLSLLKPEIRMAYYQANAPFPVPGSLNSFIAAGINLTRSDAIGIGQRDINNSKKDYSLFPLYFADFVNYYVVWDLLESIQKIGKMPDVFNNLVEVDNFDKFATILSKDDCWFGYLEKVNNFNDLVDNIKRRIYTYRQFQMDNIRKMPRVINETKTNIGNPISRTAMYLKEANVIKAETPIFIRIDQLEVLLESADIENELGHQYRKIINKALSTRDPAISYKIGIRTHAWAEDVGIYRTDSDLEHERDYRIADLDEKLRRKENVETWILPNFASDVFNRRLYHAGYNVSEKDIIGKYYGKGFSPPEIAQKYARSSQPVRTLKIQNSWPENWKNFLTSLFQSNPLNAILASGWVRQRGMGKKSENRINQEPPKTPPYPWENKWWKKERTSQALMQLAARCGQRMLWAGKEQVLALTGTNILIFISISQHIWDTFIRIQKEKSFNNNVEWDFKIPEDVQTVGIYSASIYWFNKISEQPGGNSRKRFIEFLGRKFRKELLDDIVMSYPGHNGFSIANHEIESDSEERNFLKQAVNFGVLLEAYHTTKTADKLPRTKWYLNPVYSPYFSIPENHIKEPIYLSINDFKIWRKKAKLPQPSMKNPAEPNTENSEQLTLPMFEDI